MVRIVVAYKVMASVERALAIVRIVMAQTVMASVERALVMVCIVMVCLVMASVGTTLTRAGSSTPMHPSKKKIQNFGQGPLSSDRRNSKCRLLQAVLRRECAGWMRSASEATRAQSLGAESHAEINKSLEELEWTPSI